MATRVLTVEQVAVALDVKRTSPSARRAAVYARLSALGYDRECGRCGGSGHYSFNAQHGSRCYGCDGRGTVVPRLTEKLVNEAVARQANGELESYFAKARAANELRRALKPLLAQLHDEWSNGAVHTDYMLRYPRTVHAVRVPADMSRAAELVNRAWHYGNEAEEAYRFNGVHEQVERAHEAIALVRAINAAWSEYSAQVA